MDTGHPSSAAETVGLIGQVVNPASVRLIVNTHCHWDHIGGNGALRDVSGAQTATGAATAHILTTHDRRLMWLDYFAADCEPVAVDITPDRPGEYEFHCGMNMVRGRLIVKAGQAVSH